MKTEEEILEHLKVTGYAQNSRFVIAGFLIGKNITTVDENIEIRVGDGRAGDFIKWFESEEVVKPKFKVGDWVRVTDTRQTHVTHSIAFKAMNFKNKDKNPIVENDSVGQIFGMYYCNLNRCYIYGIQFGDKQCAMNDGGFVAYYPKEGEFFYVKKYNNYEFINCRDNVRGDKSGSVLHFSYGISLDVRVLSNNRYVCYSNSILELRPATKEEIQLLKDKVKRDANKVWKDGEWIEYKQDKIAKAKQDFDKWKQDNLLLSRYLDGDNYIFTKDYKEKKLIAYAELYLFAQWQNGLNEAGSLCYYLFIGDRVKIESLCLTPEDGTIIFNTQESAQLAIDVLGEELIKTALK